MSKNSLHHELDHDLIEKYGFLPEERDLEMEAWDALPVEESIERLHQTFPIVHEITAGLMEKFDKDFLTIK